MSAQLKRFLPLIAGVAMLAFAGTASATCGNGCHKPEPKPPVHKPQPPVVNNHNKNINNNYNKNYNNNYNKNINNNNNYNKNINNVNVNVHSTNIAVATANANASSNASASGRGEAESNVFFSGGGAQVIATPGFPVLQPIGVGRSEMVRKAFTEKRSVFKQVIVQAVCIDDRGAPHPASQIFPERDVAGHYRGEVFRCIAGSKLQVTIADFLGKVSFDGGETMACVKGEALFHENGTLTCRPATPQRNCFERSLLRRHGVGVKVFQMTKIEEFTSFREEMVESAEIGAVALDGGVGGFVH